MRARASSGVDRALGSARLTSAAVFARPLGADEAGVVELALPVAQPVELAVLGHLERALRQLPARIARVVPGDPFPYPGPEPLVFVHRPHHTAPMRLFDHLDWHARERPDAAFAWFNGREISYRRGARAQQPDRARAARRGPGAGRAGRVPRQEHARVRALLLRRRQGRGRAGAAQLPARAAGVELHRERLRRRAPDRARAARRRDRPDPRRAAQGEEVPRARCAAARRLGELRGLGRRASSRPRPR